MFKLISYLEGASLLLLLFVAMPMKYMMNVPEAVSIVGMAHGVLFIAYMLFVAGFFFGRKWSLKTTVFGSVASVLPFGTFVFEGRWLKQQERPIA
ncbi:DUF3817 domain-containing protein [Shouchella shacheensis]|uniref:DUF3817 domain-containing protein n=1 Tax=Shouchella shacheensis TaxID=1649580 RepID=UPI00073FE92F|nr:DUF3817 domain-containing protein [Shouchella shacheensis]